MNFLTVHIPILHGHVDDDLVGLDDVLLLHLSDLLDWSNHRKPPGLLSQADGGLSLLHLKIQIRNAKKDMKGGLVIYQKTDVEHVFDRL